MSKNKPIPFPKTIYVQNAAENGNASNRDNNWLEASYDESGPANGIRCAIYELKEVVKIAANTTYKKEKSK